MNQFYALTKNVRCMSVSPHYAADEGTFLAQKTGSFLAETVAIAPRLVVGFAGARGNTTSLNPSAGAWGLINGAVGKVARGTGYVAGLAGGAATSPIGLALGYGFKGWITGATKLGVAIGATLAKLPVGVSETARATCGRLTGLTALVIANLCGQVGGTVGTLVDFATAPRWTANNLSTAW